MSGDQFFRRKLSDFQGGKDAQVFLYNLYTKFLEINASGLLTKQILRLVSTAEKKLLLELLLEGNYQLEREVIVNPDFNSSRVRKSIVRNGRLF
jgi:hypothetical protein